jgi:hypothetical protein
MNGKFQMQGGKNWILPKEMNAPVLPRLLLTGNLEKPLRSLFGTECRELGYGLRRRVVKTGFCHRDLGQTPMSSSSQSVSSMER